METYEVLRIIWFVLIGVLLCGYSLLDGFDLGIGGLLPFLAKDDKEKTALVKSVGPFWDGNEVWILTGGGALFAAFPHAYATVFSGFYLALMVVLFALIFRAVSLEFRSHDPVRQKLWEGAFVAGSALPALLFGVALGNVLQGVPLDSRMEFTGTFFTLLRPFPLMVGLLGLTAFLIQGSTFAALKVHGDLQERSRRTASGLVWLFAAFWAAAFLLSLKSLPDAVKKLPAWVFTGVLIVSLILLSRSLRRKRDGAAFVFSSLNFAALWGIVGSVHYPHLVRASNDPGLSITIHNAASSRLTLTVMLIIALVGMPIVIGYTVFLYRVFRGKIEDGDEEYG